MARHHDIYIIQILADTIYLLTCTEYKIGSTGRREGGLIDARLDCSRLKSTDGYYISV